MVAPTLTEKYHKGLRLQILRLDGTRSNRFLANRRLPTLSFNLLGDYADFREETGESRFARRS